MYKSITAALCFVAIASSAPLSGDPPQPHLAQAWTAMSKGDGLPGQVGFESYLFEDSKAPGSVRGHIWDYTGPASGSQNCKKIEVSVNDKHALQGTFYLGCDSIDCCFATIGGHPSSNPARPDVKQWDIQKPSWIAGRQTKYIGNRVTDDLFQKNITAETWFNKDTIPFTPLSVNYTYYITHKGNDVISHKIHYAPPPETGASPGDILYGNFTVQHDLDTFRKVFVPPQICYPQGSGKGHALACGDAKMKEWERKFFKHSATSKGLKPVQQGNCTIELTQGERFHRQVKPIRGLTQDECCAKCEASPDCEGFAFESRDLRDLFSSRCELHTASDGFGGKVESSHWVAGKK